ncbi:MULTISPECIES: hypothetical protein [unclassified Bacillus cereus group]|uniref:hypothetical protein n=1 Tax=unclassified Bacillus cereus group TaxID=2750818 RepID=UPI0029C308B0|nr:MULTISPECIES: hypothetical protein [unclassified Bacillus cereus group]MDX5880811.1 hypothetical protein [Bacillus cereus group sp. BfR-BA-01042]MDX5906673.1 hypothetical protein [Bacillus cereus group sp. BfR-BA-01048]
MNTKRFIEGRFEDCELSCIFLCQKTQNRIKIYKFEMEDDIYKTKLILKESGGG